MKKSLKERFLGTIGAIMFIIGAIILTACLMIAYGLIIGFSFIGALFIVLGVGACSYTSKNRNDR